MSILREQVFNSLDTARENGYDLRAIDPVTVAEDMLNCDNTYEGLSDVEAITLLLYVKEWQKERHGK
jgi:hypothetical protein